MKAKIFHGRDIKSLGKNLNHWLEKTELSFIQVSTAFSVDTFFITLVYQEKPKPKERERGDEQPGDPPTCVCGEEMIKRNRRTDGAPFWGCPRYPKCRHIEQFDEDDMKAEQERGQRDDRDFIGGDNHEGGEPQFGPDDDDIPF